MRLTTIVPTLAAAKSLPATGRDGYQLQAVFGVALLLLLVTACTARTTADPVSSDPTFVGPAPPTTGAPVTTAATGTLPPTSTTAPLAAPSCLDGPLPGLELASVAFFAGCESELASYPVERKGSSNIGLSQSLVLLVEGTTAEERAHGLSTGFDWVAEADQIEVVASVDQAGLATVDFLIDGERWNPGTLAGTSGQLSRFIDPVEATVFAYPDVTALDRSTMCWGELGCTVVTTRESWQGGLFVNSGILFHRGCDLAAAIAESWDDDHGPMPCTVDAVPVDAAAVVSGVAADDTLNMRAGVGVEYRVVAELAPGSAVEVLDASDVASDGGLWRLVRAGDREAGWVNAAYLDIERTAAEAMVDAFVAYARTGVEDDLTALRLQNVVGLGLGPTVLGTFTVDELRNPTSWRLDLNLFRARSGEVSLLDVLAELDDYDVTVGPHDNCNAPAVPPPDGLERAIRISVQPVLDRDSSCHAWYTVDFFVDSGEVAAITLDMWEP